MWAQDTSMCDNVCRYHISYVVIQIVLCNLELQELGIWQTIQNDS